MKHGQLQRLIAVMAINIPLMAILHRLLNDALIVMVADFLLCLIFTIFVQWLYWYIYKN